MSERAVFAPRTVFWLLTIGTISFVGALVLSLLAGDGGAVRSAGANTFSYSAIGHRAFVEILERVEMPVLVSRYDSAGKAGSSSLLVIAEPKPPTATATELKRLLSARNVLLVLPKWDGAVRGLVPDWLAGAELMPADEAQQMLTAVLGAGSVLRPEGGLTLDTGPFPSPTLAAPQLFQAPGIDPVIGGPQGILLGRLDRGWSTIWVLSDPDILSNHGIGQGDNALLAVRMIDHVRPQGGAIVIDETIHGFEAEPQLTRAIFETPLAITAVIAVVTLAVLLWAATARFGAPLPTTRPIAPGKAGLIDNTASLLEFGGHGVAILNRYLRVTLRDVSQALHAPAQLRGDALVGWFDRIGKRRGVGVTCAEICREVAGVARQQRVDGARLARAAQSVNRWKQEMLHGPAGHSIGQGRSEGTDP